RPSLALSEVALDICLDVVMSKERDSFASARSSGRVRVSQTCSLPWKESPRDFRRRLTWDQVVPAPRPPDGHHDRLARALGSRLRLPPGPPVRLPSRHGAPRARPPPLPAHAFFAPPPLVQGLDRFGRRRRSPPGAGGPSLRHLDLCPGPDLRRPAGPADREYLQSRQLPPAAQEKQPQAEEARQALLSRLCLRAAADPFRFAHPLRPRLLHRGGLPGQGTPLPRPDRIG